MKKREYLDYIQDIVESINDIESFTKGIDFNDFIKDKKTINAVVRSLEVIGKASKKVPENIKKKYPALPWKQMAKMRDKLIHEYFGVDVEIVWKVVNDELPPLKPLIQQILGNLK